MNFGVIIRSIGERTERLCHESAALHVPEQNIHLLRNYCPSYKAYREMFKIAGARGYDWYLGLDADVVLKENWWELFNKNIKAAREKGAFRFHFAVMDKLMSAPVFRGNHFYNGQYTGICAQFLEHNIRIGRYWFYYRFKGLRPGLFLKPETSIRTHMREKLAVEDAIFDEIIGFHSYEQYYAEIYRQYITRRRRDTDFINKLSFNYLDSTRADMLRTTGDMDRFVACLAWNAASEWKIKTIDGRINSKARMFLEDQGIAEKAGILCSLDDFYATYSFS
jgi:hypothetical protein